MLRIINYFDKLLFTDHGFSSLTPLLSKAERSVLSRKIGVEITMQFYEALNEIMKKHNIKAIDICRECGLKRPYLSKIMSGNLTPSSYEIVERIINSIDMTIAEKELLTDSYQMSVSSEADKILWKSFQQAYSLSLPSNLQTSPVETFSLANGAVIAAPLRLDAVAKRILNGASDNVGIFFSAISVGVSERLSHCLSEMPAETSIKWIMPLNGDKSGNDMNFTLMINAFTMFCARPVKVLKREENVPLLLNNPFPFYIITDKELLIFDENFEMGQYFNDTGIVRLYRENFSKRSKETTPFLGSFDRAEPVLKYLSEEMFSMEKDPENVYYTVSNVPCIIFDISTSDVHKYTVEQNEQSHDFANMYLNFIANVAKTSNQVVDIFSMYGLLDYLDNDEWYELGRHFSKSISKDFRRQMVKSSMNYAKVSQNSRLHALKIPGFNNNAFIGVNIWTSGYMIFLYDFDEKPVVITAKDRGIAGSMISYIKKLHKHGIIASQEETASYIDKLLTERMADG